MAFVVAAAGEADFILPRQFEDGDEVDDEVGGSLNIGRHVEIFAGSDAVERAGRDISRVVAAGADAVDAVLETVLVEVEDGLFVEMMDLQGFTGREMDEVRIVFVEGFFQKGDVSAVDSPAGEAEAQHAAVGAAFAVAAEFAGNAFIFAWRQFFGVKSLGRFDELGKRLRISSFVSAVI